VPSSFAAHRSEKTFVLESQTISGMIAFALSQSPNGAVASLRKAISDVLKQNAHVHFNVLPPAIGSGPHANYRKAVFDLLLVGEESIDLRRRATLERLLRGSDFQSKRIDVYISGDENKKRCTVARVGVQGRYEFVATFCANLP
jgi:hypothetical protein